MHFFPSKSHNRPLQEMNTLSYYCALVALVSDYLDVTSYELALVSVTHGAMTAQ